MVIEEIRRIAVLVNSNTCTTEKCIRDKIKIENAAEILVSSQKEQEETATTHYFSKVTHKRLMIA